MNISKREQILRLLSAITSRRADIILRVIVEQNNDKFDIAGCD